MDCQMGAQHGASGRSCRPIRWRPIRCCSIRCPQMGGRASAGFGVVKRCIGGTTQQGGGASPPTAAREGQGSQPCSMTREGRRQGCSRAFCIVTGDMQRRRPQPCAARSAYIHICPCRNRMCTACTACTARTRTMSAKEAWVHRCLRCVQGGRERPRSQPGTSAAPVQCVPRQQAPHPTAMHTHMCACVCASPCRAHACMHACMQ